jgi:5-hydroxyisourate hydrolase
MRSVSTHVLDITRGHPAADVPVTLEKKQGEGYIRINAGRTDGDGRVKDLVAEGQLTTGTYRITFDTGAYFVAQGVEGFYPEASIVFVIRDESAHYHVPLLLSAFGYSTYRGS